MPKTQVVAAIIKKNNFYLIAQRNKKKHLGLKWEFPGGKVDIDETFEQSLIREIKEELNISISIQYKITDREYKDNIIDIHLHYFLCFYEHGKIKLNEHENINWVEKKHFKYFDFVEVYKKIISFL